MTALNDPNYGHMPLRDYSLGLGEVLSKTARHELCALCLAAIQRDLSKKEDNPRQRRGRPQSPSTILASQINVTYDTIRRWADFEKIQSCDANAVKLAEVAYGYDPVETVKILRADIENRRVVVEDWISQRLPLPETGINNNIATGPCVENIESEEGA